MIALTWIRHFAAPMGFRWYVIYGFCFAVKRSFMQRELVFYMHIAWHALIRT